MRRTPVLSTVLAVGVPALAGRGSDDDGGGAASGQPSSPDGTTITSTTAPAALPAH
ncbi:MULTISPECIES: hypothetical protein [unclassified Geodermatophilus]|uniref:hypothetical protein n=1 Tax=unclassified Geodermatophilus TaxID=2637632 RepID=UPI003EE96BDD